MKEKIKKEFYVEGMHCAACEMLVEKKLSKLPGVEKVDAKLNSGKVFLEVNKEISASELSTFVEKDGYKIVEKLKKETINVNEFVIAGSIAAIIIVIFIVVQELGIVNLIGDQNISLPFVFFIGVIASLSSCMAIVGGLVLSISSNYAKEKKVRAILTFHISRIIGFFLLGGIIGLIGSAFTLNSQSTFILNLLLFFTMLIMGINLLEIFPWAKRLQLRIPKVFTKNVINSENNTNIFSPMILGLITFILPCGFTQAMQIHSLETGNFFTGALTMLVFALGTFPVLALISFTSVKLSKGHQSAIFFKTSGFIIIFFSLFNFLSALVAIGLIRPIFNI